VAKAADIAKSAWASAATSLQNYGATAAGVGKSIGGVLTGAFKGAENAFMTFVKTGKLNFRSLISSMLADLALLAFKKAVLGPLADAMSFMFAPNPLFSVLHAGGIVGEGGPTRAVPAMAFAGAQRMHTGGFAGLAPNEVPAILQRGERVISTADVAAGKSGSTTHLQVSLSPDLEARILESARNQSVAISQTSLSEYDRLIAPRTIQRVAANPGQYG